MIGSEDFANSVHVSTRMMISDILASVIQALILSKWRMDTDAEVRPCSHLVSAVIVMKKRDFSSLPKKKPFDSLTVRELI